MNILIVHPCKGFYGGAEEVVVQLCRYLEANKHSIRLVTRNNPKQLETWIQLPKPKTWMDFRNQVQYTSDWADVVNVHNFPATLMTFPKKVPTVYMCNEPAELFTNLKRKPTEAFNRWWVKKSNMKVVVADEYSKKRFKRIYGVEPTVIPYGIDYKFWSREPKSSYAGKGLVPLEGIYYGNKVRLLQVGTITPYKNPLASIRALSELIANGINATITFSGGFVDFLYAKEIRDAIHHCGFEDKVTFLGQQTQEEVRKLYNNHDVLLHPVREQGGWLVPFEAACTGIKVIVSKDFQVADFFGCYIEDMESVLSYLEAPKEDIPMHQPSKEWVKENLTWEKFGEGMVEVFKESIGG